MIIARVALAIIPIPHIFSEHFTSSMGAAGATLSPPTGAQVTGHWMTSDDGSLTFEIGDSNSNVIYESEASSGSFNFTASNPPYTFAASSFFTESVSCSGTYSSPLIKVGCRAKLSGSAQLLPAPITAGRPCRLRGTASEAKFTHLGPRLNERLDH